MRPSPNFKDFKRLPVSEQNKLLPLMEDFLSYLKVMVAAVLSAIVVMVLGYASHSRDLVTIGLSCLIGFAVLTFIGVEVKARKLDRLYVKAFEALDASRDKES